jgi:hypothetical protein
MPLVLPNGFAVFQDFLAGSDQRQQMLPKTLPKFNRFTDLEEEKDLMGTFRTGCKMVVAKERIWMLLRAPNVPAVSSVSQI